MQLRQIIISIVLSLLFLGGAAIAYQYLSVQKKSTVSDTPIKEEVRYVKTSSFQPQTIKSTIELDGRLNALEKADLFAEVPGKIVDLGKRFKEGDSFQKGDLLYQIENQDERYTLYAQRSSLLNAITQIMPDLKFDYPQAFQNWKSYLDNFDVERSVRKLPEVTTQQEKYFVAGKNIYNLYYNIKSMEQKMENYQIYAPFSGVFLTVNTYPGSLVSPGMSLARLMNNSQYELVAPINMADFKYIRVGQKVSLESEDLDKKWTGYINRVSNQIDQATQSIPLYITVSGNQLRDGMFLKGSLSGNNIRDAFAVPKSIIFDQNKVLVVEDSFLVHKQVDVIKREESRVIVSGLTAEDQVVSEGVNRLFKGQKVIVKN